MSGQIVVCGRLDEDDGGALVPVVADPRSPLGVTQCAPDVAVLAVEQPRKRVRILGAEYDKAFHRLTY